MTRLKHTAHAGRRIRQRGYLERDLEFVLRHGTEVADGVVMTKQDRDRLIQESKAAISAAERLTGTRLVLQVGETVTVYRANDHQIRKLLHGY